MEARSGEEEISGDEEPADGEDIANSVSYLEFLQIFQSVYFILMNLECRLSHLIKFYSRR